MKRFFCNTCQRVKRVRQYPADITSQHSDNVMARVGTCARHSIEPVIYIRKSDVKAEFTKAILNIPAKSKRRA
jgi:hypothetical protein